MGLKNNTFTKINSDTNQNYMTLKLKCSNKFLPIVTSFAEEAAGAFGFGIEERFSLRLGAEEIYSYICKILSFDTFIEIIVSNGGYFMELSFIFSGHIPLRTFNLTTSISLDNDQDIDELGLMLASRTSDKFQVYEDNKGNICLSLIKEKTYPFATKEKELPSFKNIESSSVTTPNNEELKLFSKYLSNFPNNQLIPDFINYPGKLVDMVTNGTFNALIAKTTDNHITGGIIWNLLNHKLIEFYGPYTLTPNLNKDINEQLIEHFIQSVAKSGVTGLFSKVPNNSLSLEYFEKIGELRVHNTSKEQPDNIQVYFRQLNEDSGGTVWCDISVKDFLFETYSNLFLTRNIEVVKEMGEIFSPYSVISAEINRFQKTAVLRVIEFGADIKDNLYKHIQLLNSELINNIFFEIDLGISWQAYTIPALKEANFTPKVVIPSAGVSDIIIFQWIE